jgi:hypothetical protein
LGFFFKYFIFHLQAQGGGLAFIHTGANSEEGVSDERFFELLAYVNGVHEYVLLDPHGKQGSISNIPHMERRIISKETGWAFCFIFAQISLHIFFSTEIFHGSLS